MKLDIRVHQPNLGAFRESLVPNADVMKALKPVDLSGLMNPLRVFRSEGTASVKIVMFPPLTMPNPFFVGVGDGPYVQVSGARVDRIFMDQPYNYVFQTAGGQTALFAPRLYRADLYPQHFENCGISLPVLESLEKGALLLQLDAAELSRRTAPTTTITIVEPSKKH